MYCIISDPDLFILACRYAIQQRLQSTSVGLSLVKISATVNAIDTKQTYFKDLAKG